MVQLPSTIFAWNTNSLDIADPFPILSDNRKSKKISYRPHISSAGVEIFREFETSEDTSRRVVDYAKSIHVPIKPHMMKLTLFDYPYIMEAVRRLERSNSSPADIDRGMNS